jgi:hypothetical protein
MADSRGGLRQAVADEFDFAAAVGGVRGLVESAVPTVVFTLVYTFGKDLSLALLTSLGTAVVLGVVRLAMRETVMQAVSGFIGVAIAAAIASSTGAARDFFLFPIMKNAFFVLLCVGSIVVRWPYVGVLLGFVLGEGTHWRTVPARMRAYVIATWLWVAMFGIRLAFQIPLYLDDRTTELGVASLPLGLPLFGVVVLLCWVVVRRVPMARPPEQDEQPDRPAVGQTVEQPDDGPGDGQVAVRPEVSGSPG